MIPGVISGLMSYPVLLCLPYDAQCKPDPLNLMETDGWVQGICIELYSTR